jgi:hypothetical protein
MQGLSGISPLDIFGNVQFNFRQMDPPKRLTRATILNKKQFPFIPRASPKLRLSAASG